MFLLFLQLISSQIYDGKVVGVTDGDTITVLVGTEQKKIRLAEIDAPEKSQAFGNLSKMMLSEKVFGKEVRVTVSNKDRYNRYVGKVTCNGRNVNEEMVKEGYAWHYKQYESVVYIHKMISKFLRDLIDLKFNLQEINQIKN